MFYLRSEKKTTPSLNVKINGVVYYGNMSTAVRTISAGSERKLKIKDNGTVYHVHDDSVGGDITGLPSGYTAVEYIRSSGSSYADTGISPDASTRVDYKVKFDSSQSVSSAPLIGARVGTGNESRFFPISYSGTTNFRTTFGNKEGNGTIDFNTEYEGSFQPANNVSTINGTSYNISSAGFTKTANNNLYLFATTGYGSELYQSKGFIYYVRIFDGNGALKFNGIAARNSSGVCGFYDTVSGTFKTSATSTAFSCPN